MVGAVFNDPTFAEAYKVAAPDVMKQNPHTPPLHPRFRCLRGSAEPN